MVRYYKLDEDKNVIPTEVFRQNIETRLVARTDLRRVSVSTVFLSMDHAWRQGPPMIFETMVFPDCDICERYSTWDEAVAGHENMVKRMRY